MRSTLGRTALLRDPLATGLRREPALHLGVEHRAEPIDARGQHRARVAFGERIGVVGAEQRLLEQSGHQRLRRDPGLRGVARPRLRAGQPPGNRAEPTDALARELGQPLLVAVAQRLGQRRAERDQIRVVATERRRRVVRVGRLSAASALPSTAGK